MGSRVCLLFSLILWPCYWLLLVECFRMDDFHWPVTPSLCAQLRECMFQRAGLQSDCLDSFPCSSDWWHVVVGKLLTLVKNWNNSKTLWFIVRSDCGNTNWRQGTQWKLATIFAYGVHQNRIIYLFILDFILINLIYLLTFSSTSRLLIVLSFYSHTKFDKDACYIHPWGRNSLSVSSSHHNKAPQIGRLKSIEIYFLIVVETESPRSRCCLVQFVIRSSSCLNKYKDTN